MTMNVWLIGFLGVVFAAALILSYARAHRFYSAIASHAEQFRASEVRSIMYTIAIAPLVASVCLVGLSIALAGFACLLQTHKHATMLRDDVLSR